MRRCDNNDRQRLQCLQILGIFDYGRIPVAAFTFKSSLRVHLRSLDVLRVRLVVADIRYRRFQLFCGRRSATSDCES